MAALRTLEGFNVHIPVEPRDPSRAPAAIGLQSGQSRSVSVTMMLPEEAEDAQVLHRAFPRSFKDTGARIEKVEQQERPQLIVCFIGSMIAPELLGYLKKQSRASIAVFTTVPRIDEARRTFSSDLLRLIDERGILAEHPSLLNRLRDRASFPNLWSTHGLINLSNLGIGGVGSLVALYLNKGNPIPHDDHGDEPEGLDKEDLLWSLEKAVRSALSIRDQPQPTLWPRGVPIEPTVGKATERFIEHFVGEIIKLYPSIHGDASASDKLELEAHRLIRKGLLYADNLQRAIFGGQVEAARDAGATEWEILTTVCKPLYVLGLGTEGLTVEDRSWRDDGSAEGTLSAQQFEELLAAEGVEGFSDDELEGGLRDAITAEMGSKPSSDPLD